MTTTGRSCGITKRVLREELVDGQRHVFEAEIKQRRRTHGRPGHEAAP